MSNKIYPIGIQNFEKLRREKFFYVDKTAQIYQMVKSGCYYFLSRPRRFGKSLLISTLEAYFRGKKELFEGLAIGALEQEWETYPVLHLDLNIERYETPDSLSHILNNNLTRWEKLYGADESETSFSLRFAGVIRRAYEKTGRRVVILVDEYDKPMLQAIGNEALQEEFRNALKSFYGALKSMDGCIRFALLTGVTKFGKVSVFSDLNNLKDISMDHRYITLCGLTEEELHDNLKEEIHELARLKRLTDGELCAELKRNYDGYHFSEDSVGVYNPFSVFNALDSQHLGSYWFETGTPTYLVKLLKMHHYDLEKMSHEVANRESLNSIDSASTDPIPVIYQSGYLTIKDYNKEFGVYHLGFPNREVEEGFMRFLMPYYANVEPRETTFEIQKFISEVRGGEVDAFFRRLRGFFSDVPYEMVRRQELHYQNVLFILFKLMGFHTQVEYHTSEGRVDLVMQTDRYIYVMEFKLDGTAEDALRQINEKHYARPFEADSRTLYKIGVNFSNETRNIDKWVVEC